MQFMSESMKHVRTSSEWMEITLKNTSEFQLHEWIDDGSFLSPKSLSFLQLLILELCLEQIVADLRIICLRIPILLWTHNKMIVYATRG